MRNVRSASWPMSQRPTIGTATPGYTHDFGVVGIPMLDRNRNITPIHPHTYLRQHLHRLPALSCQHPRQGQKPNRLLVLTDVGQHCQGRQITNAMVDEFEKYVANTLNLKLDEGGCDEAGLYGYLFHTVPVFRGKHGRPPTYDLALAQRTREFFRSMIGCFDGMYTEYQERIKIKFEDGHARNVVDVFLEMPDCCRDDELIGRVHTWPAWLGLQIHATWLFKSGYFSNLTHPDYPQKKFGPKNTLGCFFSGWWYGYLLWREKHFNNCARLMAWLTDLSSGVGQRSYHNIITDDQKSKAISESYRYPHRRTVTTDRGIQNPSRAVDPISFLNWLLGRLDYFRLDKDKKIEPSDYSWITIDKATKVWPKTLTCQNSLVVADSVSLSMHDWDMKERLQHFAEQVVKQRQGLGGCVRVSRKQSYTVTESNAEMELETQPDFHKTVLFDWPFLLRAPCSGSKAKGKAS